MLIGRRRYGWLVTSRRARSEVRFGIDKGRWKGGFGYVCRVLVYVYGLGIWGLSLVYDVLKVETNGWGDKEGNSGEEG